MEAVAFTAEVMGAAARAVAGLYDVAAVFAVGATRDRLARAVQPANRQ